MDDAEHTAETSSGLGFRADDPGVRMLGEALADADPSGVLLVHCGDLPGVRPGATRLVADVRELAGSAHACVPPGPQADAVAGMRHAALWPRAHLGKDFSEACLGRAALALAPGGHLWCAVRKRKGAAPLRATIEALLGGVEVVRRGRGYRLFRAERGARIDDDLARELVGRRYVIRDPVLGDLELHSAPGVFSRRELDAGTRCLLEHVAARGGEAPGHVVDLCAGIGPLAIWAARRWPGAHVRAVESNLIATELLRDNARAAGVDARVEVLAADGLPARADGDRADLALVNPPTHAGAAALERLFTGLAAHMTSRGRALVVASRPAGIAKLLARVAGDVRAFPYARYTVLEATGFASAPAPDPASAP